MTVALRARMAEDRLTWHLDNWAEWMRHGRMPVEGYSPRASGGIIGRSGLEFDEMVAGSDMICARAVDALLDSMVPRLRLAVYVTHGITTVYRLRANVEESYLQARVLIQTGLIRRGIP